MRQLTWPVKISYGIGAFGKDLVYAIVATFYMFYLTDVCKIDPIFIGNLFLFARLFDAVNDPVMGLVVDNTRTRWGKFRPWILLGDDSERGGAGVSVFESRSGRGASVDLHCGDLSPVGRYLYLDGHSLLVDDSGADGR